MITKRNGHGQTECRGCKNKGKYALNWDCFLYNFDNEPYCFDCLMEKLEQLQQENQELKEQNKKEFADYIKFKKEQYDEYLEKINKLIKENQELKKQLENNSKINVSDHKYASTCEDKVIILETQQKEFIKYLEDEKDRLARECSNIYEDSLGHTRLVNADIFDEVNEILQKYKSIIGDKDE